MTSYVCAQLDTTAQTCVAWVEQATLNDLFGITLSQAVAISMGIALLFVVSAIFNRLSKIGE